MASPVDTSVKFYCEDFPGAPVLNGVAGSLIGLLDACLCTGFGLRSATGLVVAGGVATLTLAGDAKNGNLLNSVILVAGSSIAALNGEQRVTFASSTELKFATAAADGTATGSITVKTAPAGWEKKFSGTHKAVFKSLSVEANMSYLRVDDAGTNSARVRAYETMADADTGTGATPRVEISQLGGYWGKSVAPSETAVRWDLFADARAFFYCPAPYSAYGNQYIGQGAWFFGDITAYRSGDAYSTALFAGASDNSNSIHLGSICELGQYGSVSSLLRSYTAVGSAVAAFPKPVCGAGYSGDDQTFGTFPSLTDGALLLSEYVITEGANNGQSLIRRGIAPGARHAPQLGLGSAFQRGNTIQAAGRRYYATYAGSSASAVGTSGGRMFFDITGPWR